VLVGCALAWLATDGLPRGLIVDPIGPAYFPRFIILSIAGLGLALLLLTLRDLRRRPISAPPPSLVPDVEQAIRADLAAAPAAAPPDADEEMPPIYYPRLLGLLALSIVYVLLMTPLGYFISSVIYVTLILLMLRVRRVAAIVGCALGVPLVLQLLFQKLLSVPLPGGVLDNLPFTIPF